MNARTPLIAADVAWGARGIGIPAELILGYSGPAYAGLDQIRAWAKPFLLGYESTTTRSYAGGDAGQADIEQLISVARTIPGYLKGGCGFWMCAADETSTPAWAWPGITDYFRRATARYLAEIGQPPAVPPYGNRDAVAAAHAGIVAGGGIPLDWGVGTWGYGEGRGANQPPDVSDAAMLQSGNTPGPAEGTDLDWLYVPLERFRAWGGPTPAPSPLPSTSEEDDMRIVVGQVFGRQGWIAWKVAGNQILKQWAEYNGTSGGPAVNDIPPAVAAYVARAGYHYDVSFLDPDEMHELVETNTAFLHRQPEHA